MLRGCVTIIVLAAMLGTAWYLNDWADNNRPIVIDTRSDMGKDTKISVKDGDSFTVGINKLRLDGIDAPEFSQTCKDASGKDWSCGRSARAALERLLTEPDLICQAEARDRYARSLATCRTTQTPNIAAKQVRDGLAVSDEYFGSRSFGDEEDEARSAKRGIWAGAFEHPEEWRATHQRNDGL